MFKSTIIALLLLSGLAGGWKPKGKNMEDILVHVPSLEHVFVGVPMKSLTNGLVDEVSPRQATRDAGDLFPCTFGNPGKNSRIRNVINEGAYELAWSKTLPLSIGPSRLLVGGERVLLQGISEWLLFDLQGTCLSRGRRGFSDCIIDGKAGSFYFVDSDGYLTCCNLQKGERTFSISLPLSKHYSRPFLSVQGNKIVITGQRQAIQPEQPDVPAESKLEVIEVAEKKIIDQYLRLTSYTGIAAFSVNQAPMLAASDGKQWVFALPNRIYIFDKRHTPHLVLKGTFIPMQMSMDENGNLYLAVVDHDGKSRLWVTTPEGNRYISVALPFELSCSPVVAWDHSIYCVSDTLVAYLSSEGKELWQTHAIGQLQAVVTGDNRLLASEESVVSIFDNAGDRRVIFGFPGETVVSQPVVLDDASIIIATNGRLHRLIPKKQ